MKEQFARTALLLGEEGVERLERARVAVFGIGGVGGYTVEALARSGVGHFLLVDSDRVALSNLNRQIIATLDTVGRYKTQVMKERILSINPDAEVETRECFFLPENAEEFDFSGLDYVVDAVDTVTAKLELILRARRFGVPVISSMGAGNKLDASRLEVADIYQTSVCPLARVMRRELKARGVERLKVVYSREEAIKPGAGSGKAALPEEKTQTSASGRRAVPGSVVFVPGAAGLILAGEVVRDLCKV
ncbi:MAG TPA: tRNA threonylcarbamoyladenosine dehydratase [Candidatus Eisenbergiella stercoravium]|nr:tRNA threonylcarbamoyladenosine dehydratase [Candidatus Eisenbergiella stercoravium]